MNKIYSIVFLLVLSACHENDQKRIVCSYVQGENNNYNYDIAFDKNSEYTHITDYGDFAPCLKTNTCQNYTGTIERTPSVYVFLWEYKFHGDTEKYRLSVNRDNLAFEIEKQDKPDPSRLFGGVESTHKNSGYCREEKPQKNKI